MGLEVDGGQPGGDEARVGAARRATLGEALRSPAFWVFALSSAAYGLVASGIGLFNESILAERGFAPDVYYTALAVTAITGLAGNFAAGALADRGSLRQVLLAALLVLTGALVGAGARDDRRAGHGAGGRDGRGRRLRDGRVLQLLGPRLRPRASRPHPGRRAGPDGARLGGRTAVPRQLRRDAPARTRPASTRSRPRSRRSPWRPWSCPFPPVRSGCAPPSGRRVRPRSLIARGLGVLLAHESRRRGRRRHGGRGARRRAAGRRFGARQPARPGAAAPRPHRRRRRLGRTSSARRWPPTVGAHPDFASSSGRGAARRWCRASSPIRRAGGAPAGCRSTASTIASGASTAWPAGAGIGGSRGALSPALAREIGAATDRAVLVRVERPSDIPLESLHGRKEDVGRTLRLTVRDGAAGVAPRRVLARPAAGRRARRVRAAGAPAGRSSRSATRVNALLVRRCRRSETRCRRSRAPSSETRRRSRTSASR